MNKPSLQVVVCLLSAGLLSAGLLANGCARAEAPAAQATSGTDSGPAADAAAVTDSSGAIPAEKDSGSEDPFSFFVTSLQAMQIHSESADGFGGNLGGLAGADSICQKIAAEVGAANKTWRAFLSVTKGPDGGPVNAIDRIGSGPWYDRNGRLVAEDIQGLLQQRPDGDPQIANDLPNEFGQSQKQFGDNHDVLTGSNKDGQLNNSDPVSTCQDWTSAVGPGSEKKVMAGHSWPSTKSPGWLQAHPVPGCAAGVQLKQTGNGSGTNHVGGAGGYGGIYCFALTP